MAGIYIHIPFCSSKCHYCNFLSTVSLKYKTEVVSAIIKEIHLRNDYITVNEVNTIYYGGGTPTVLSLDELIRIHKAIENNFHLSNSCEITMEANPDDLYDEKLAELLEIGVNRLSIGTQAFDDNILKRLNRRHTAMQSVEAVKNAQQMGYNNISIDLIYGIPGLTNNQWEDEIKRALDLNIQHISAYHLTVEPGTALEILIRKNKFPHVDDDLGMQQFDILMDKLEQSGFLHYEISNFCQPSYKSRHNSGYWNREEYLGVGPSAHSFNGKSRSWNTSNLRKYFESIQNQLINSKEELLTNQDIYNEFVMLGLRTMEGISKQQLHHEFENYSHDFKLIAEKMISKGWMVDSKNAYILTRAGKIFADGISAEFFQ